MAQSLANYIETDNELDEAICDTYLYAFRQFIIEINYQFSEMKVSRTLEIADDFKRLSQENASLIKAYEGLVGCLRMTDKRRINVSQLYSHSRKILQVTSAIIQRGGI